MPDLRTELRTKVLPVFKPQSLDSLKFDDGDDEHDDTPTQPAVVSKGVTQATFQLIKDNPNTHTMAEATRLLGARGYKKASVASLLSQMHRAGAVSKDPAGRLYAIDTVLRKLPAGGKYKRKTAGPTKRGHTKVPAQKPAPELPINIDVESMTLREARALYNELKKIFGGS
jgi:hypothetical protein